MARPTEILRRKGELDERLNLLHAWMIDPVRERERERYERVGRRGRGGGVQCKQRTVNGLINLISR